MAEIEINHPSYYGGDDVYEVVKVLEAWGLDTNARLFNAVKYIARAGKKEGAPYDADLKKAQWYLTREIDKLALDHAIDKFTEEEERRSHELAAEPPKSRTRSSVASSRRGRKPNPKP
jgi:hypothetical protein